MKNKVFIAGVIAATFVAQQVMAANTTGTARQVVTAAIAIANVSDLDFGSAAQGDAAKVVAPGTAENAENGSFNVTGQANQAYTITLPATSINLTSGANTIAVSAFASFPAAGANGTLNGTGSQLLLVGATRAALSPTQFVGTYTGTYTVDVVY